MLDQKTQKLMEEIVDKKLLERDQQAASGLYFQQNTGRAFNGKNVYGVTGDRVIHNSIRTNLTDQTIASGVINFTSSDIRIYTESSAASDDLDTINPYTLAQGRDIVIIQAADDGDTIIVKSGTGNLVCAGGVGMSLDTLNDRMCFQWEPVQAKWIELWRVDSNNQAVNTDQHVDIVAFHPSASGGGGWTNEYRAVMMGGDIYSSGTQNDYIQYNVYMSPGTYTLYLMHHKDTNRGIYTIYIDDLTTGTPGTTSIGTIDGYAAAPANNFVSNITSIAITTGGQKAIRLTMATKNAAATAYTGVISLITLNRNTLP